MAKIHPHNISDSIVIGIAITKTRDWSEIRLPFSVQMTSLFSACLSPHVSSGGVTRTARRRRSSFTQYYWWHTQADKTNMICHNRITAHPSLCTTTIRCYTNVQYKLQPSFKESLEVCKVTYHTEVNLDEPGHEHLQSLKLGLVRKPSNLFENNNYFFPKSFLFLNQPTARCTFAIRALYCECSWVFENCAVWANFVLRNSKQNVQAMGLESTFNFLGNRLKFLIKTSFVWHKNH